MKLTILLLTVGFLNVSAAAFSQKINYNGTNVSLEAVFYYIEKQTDFVFMFKEGVLNNTSLLTIKATEEPIEAFLNRLFNNQPFNYKIAGKSIFVTRKPVLPITPPALQSNAPHENNVQTTELPVLVLDEHGKPLAGATIELPGTKKMYITNATGIAGIPVALNNIIRISFIGYATQEVTISAQQLETKSIVITLRKSTEKLDDIQITAYGKTTKRLSTANIGTITGEEIRRVPAFTVFEAIAGRVPGIIVSPTMGNSAAPVKVEIRGRNTINPLAMSDPLYVIDGIPFTTLNASVLNANLDYSTGAMQGGKININGENPLMSINPADIESIDILKDADATAIYGSRGANGVILITTKRGKPGPTSFGLSINNGFKSVIKYPELLKTEDYLAIRREAFRNDNIVPDRYNAPDLVLWDQTKYTDWQRLFGSSGSTTSINADLSGGMSQTTYSIAANYATVTEIMNNGGKNNRGSLRSSLNHGSRDQKFQVNLGTNLALTDVTSYLMGNLGSLAPNAPDIYNDKGEYNFEPYRGQYSSEFTFGDKEKPSFSSSFHLQSNIQLSYELFKGLTLSTNAGYNFSSNENSSLTPTAGRDPFYGELTSSAFYGDAINKSYTIEPQIRYRTTIGKGVLTTQLLGSVQDVKTKGNTIYAGDFPNDNLMKSYNNSNVLNLQVFEGYAEYRYISAAGIIGYNWDNKYIVNLNARRDGSTRFGPGKQFGNFGSVGAAWIVSDENWMQHVLPTWVSFFKLRGSYGITGSDGVKDYQYLSRWAKFYTDGDDRSIFKYNNIDAFSIIGALNQQFQWESTKKRELAAEFGFMNNTISLGISYYSNISGNQLTSVPMPKFTGLKTVYANWPAKVRNAGWEVTLNGNLIKSTDWSVNFNFNVGINKNKLVSFPRLENTPYNNRYIVGESLRTVYLLHYTGIDPINGTYTFEDYNKNGKLDNLGTVLPDEQRLTDRYVKLDLSPKYAGGFGTSVNYKKLAVHARFSYVNKLSPDPYLTLIAGGRNNLILPKDVLENHWQNPGDIAKYPKFSTFNSGQIGQSDAGYTNGSYIRMSSLAVSYSLPVKWIQSLRMKDVSLAIETQNLFTITSYKGFDPDIPTLTGFSPIPRTISTSIRFNF